MLRNLAWLIFSAPAGALVGVLVGKNQASLLGATVIGGLACGISAISGVVTGSKKGTDAALIRGFAWGSLGLLYGTFAGSLVGANLQIKMWVLCGASVGVVAAIIVYAKGWLLSAGRHGRLLLCVFLGGAIGALLELDIEIMQRRFSWFEGNPRYAAAVGALVWVLIVLGLQVVTRRSLGGRFLVSCPKCGAMLGLPVARGAVNAPESDQNQKEDAPKRIVLKCPRCQTQFPPPDNVPVAPRRPEK